MAVQEEPADLTGQKSDQQGSASLDLGHQMGLVDIQPLRREGKDPQLQQGTADDEDADRAAIGDIDPELVGRVVDLLLWHEGYVSTDVSKGNIEYTTIEAGTEKVEGSMEVKVDREKIAEALPQTTSEVLAIILSNLRDGKYKEGEALSAWNILTCLELWFGMRATLLDATPGSMKMKLEVAGPFRLYDLRTKELHPEAEQVVKMAVQLALPNMSSADAKAWSETRTLFKDTLETYRMRKLQRRTEKVEQDSVHKRAKLAKEVASREKAARIAAEAAASVANKRADRLEAILREAGFEVPKDL